MWTTFQCHRLWQPGEPACRVHQQDPGLFASPEDRHRRASDLRSWLEAALGSKQHPSRPFFRIVRLVRDIPLTRDQQQLD
jgi:hypothetical protein